MENLDSIVRSVINKFVERASFGKKKYGTDLDRTDLSIVDWIQHAQEEHMDAILYLEKLKQVYLEEKKTLTTKTE
jgi:hypothetical protein